LRRCRFLNEDYFSKLYACFIEAFSDYVIQFALTEPQFRNHIKLNAVDLDRTVGCEEGDRLVGFSLNGFGLWKGKLTAYDAGTGVVPSHRRQGISRDMFEMMLPLFTESGIEQFLLEVITTNSGAIALYENLGFRRVREVAVLERDTPLEVVAEQPAGLVIHDFHDPDWDILTPFWDTRPSWQNSIEAVRRSMANKRILGAFFDEECVGYVVFSSRFGRVAQLAVAPEHRRQGIGTALIRAMQGEMASGFSMQVINIDKSSRSSMDFFNKLGFVERLSQFEMIRPM
jgi:ribosomal protein S18 acetylase RimI-like enzyme